MRALMITTTLAGVAAAWLLPAAAAQSGGNCAAMPAPAGIEALGLPAGDTLAALLDLAAWRTVCGDGDGARTLYQDLLERDLAAGDGAALPGLLQGARDLADLGAFELARDYLDAAETAAEAAGAQSLADRLPLLEAGAHVERAAMAAGADPAWPEAITAHEEARDRAADQQAAAEAAGARGDADSDHVIVPVFYGTNRGRTGSENPLEFYGYERAPLELGVVTVSVPRNREIGEIRRTDRWQGDLSRLRGRYFIIERVAPFADDYAFTDALAETMDRSERRELLVFIHGYNTDFRSAAERAAQLAVDLEIDGAPALYSWPSRGSTLGYFADANEVTRPAVDDLLDYLFVLMNGAQADRVHLVAHSMGNRFLLAALDEMAEIYPAPLAEPFFDQVVWASPDVDAASFEASIPDIRHLSRDMTLYASTQDRALQLSRRVQGGYPRAGDATAPYPLVMTGLATVDTSEAGEGGLGHSDYAGPALDDFRAIIWHSLEPEERCILETGDGAYGRFYRVDVEDGGSCEPEVFQYSITALRREGADNALGALEALARDPAAPVADRIADIRAYLGGLLDGD